MTKRISALILALVLCLGLAACNGTDPLLGQSSAVVPSTAPASQAEEKPPVEMPAPPSNDQAFLTGLPKGADYPEDKRITAVMVNNIAASRPTSGLSEAKILVEIKVEAGITRFMALFEDYETLPKVGSVRSARDQFFQLLLPFWGFYVHDGPHQETHPVNVMLNEYLYGEFSLQPVTGSTFFEDRPGYTKKEYTEYTDGAHVSKAIENTSADDYRTYGRIFNFGSVNGSFRVPANEAPEVAVIHSQNYRTLFEYDEAATKYQMSMFSEYTGEVEPTVDENNGVQLSFDNLVVLFAPMDNYPDSELVRVDYSVGGAGYYFTRGRYEPIYWGKGAPNEPLFLYTWDAREEEMVQLNPGTTYLAVVDDSELPEFNAVLESGTAGEAAGEGELNPDREDPAD